MEKKDAAKTVPFENRFEKNGALFSKKGTKTVAKGHLNSASKVTVCKPSNGVRHFGTVYFSQCRVITWISHSKCEIKQITTEKSVL